LVFIKIIFFYLLKFIFNINILKQYKNKKKINLKKIKNMVRPRKNTLLTVVAAAAATRETQRKTSLSSHTHPYQIC